jgi:glycosyltransferase involved in cell wall biosynthesis
MPTEFRNCPEVTIVVCTGDRPGPLKRLLTSIEKQATSLSFEIIVVDNRPAAGATLPLWGLFDNVTWLEEPRQGISYARNAGIRVARAGTIVFADDDLDVPSTWLEGIASPVVKGQFDVVLGPIRPLKMETEAERLFEMLGGHGFPAVAAEFDAQWLKAQRLLLPLWKVGGVGNAAIRRAIFFDPSIGLFEEALGAGTPAGSWEDLYFLYRCLRANMRVRREPASAALHAHRETMGDLERQLCSYRRGEVCFCILVLLRHGDFRAISHLCGHIPRWRLQLAAGEVARRWRGEKRFPFFLLGRECLAYLEGPWALAVSLRRAAALRDPVA